MPESPSVANIVAQIAISGNVTNGHAAASRQDVINSLVELGLSYPEIEQVVEHAVKIGAIRRNDDTLTV